MDVKSVAPASLRLIGALACAGALPVLSQPAVDGPNAGRPGFGPGGPREELKLVKQFDKDGDKMLNAAEREAARAFIAREKAEGRGPRRPGGGRFREDTGAPAGAGRKVDAADVPRFPDASLYDLRVLRTLFLDFESPDWEKELEDFYNTDVEVPARLSADGRQYEGVGVHFRGASSFFTVEEGRKRSLNLAMDFLQDGQNLGGYRTLNLLNSHTDPTFARTVLYYEIAREYIPAPRANYVHLVINGESWGVYVNAQQFNKDFVNDAFGTTRGARWKVPGSPRGRGGLEYLGDDPAAYRKIYDIRSRDDAKSWADLIRLCKVLNDTPPDSLERELDPLLDIDGTLKFLALENALINSDGYWTRASDYNLYQDENGRFHLIPHDANETFRPPGGPGRGARGGANGADLDPFAGVGDEDKPLLTRLLAVPSLRERYVGYIHDIATRWLDWNRAGPVIQQYQSLINEEIRKDMRKLYPTESFTRGVTEDVEETGPRGPRRTMSLKSFVEQRRGFLLEHPEVRKAAGSKTNDRTP